MHFIFDIFFRKWDDLHSEEHHDYLLAFSSQICYDCGEVGSLVSGNSTRMIVWERAILLERRQDLSSFVLNAIHFLIL